MNSAALAQIENNQQVIIHDGSPFGTEIIISSGALSFRTGAYNITQDECNLQSPLPESFNKDCFEVTFIRTTASGRSLFMGFGSLLCGSRSSLALKEYCELS